MTGNSQLFQYPGVGSVSFFYNPFEFRNGTNFFLKNK